MNMRKAVLLVNYVGEGLSVFPAGSRGLGRRNFLKSGGGKRTVKRVHFLGRGGKTSL